MKSSFRHFILLLLIGLGPDLVLADSTDFRCTGHSINLESISNLLTAQAEEIGKVYLLLQYNREREIDCAYNGSGLNAETPLFLASSSKWFTGSLFKALENRGHLDLDAHPYEYDEDPLWLESYWPDVTIRQLLSHTSGIWRGSSADVHLWGYCNQSLADAAEVIGLLGFEEGQLPYAQFDYGSTGMQVAAHLASRSLNRPYQEIMQRFLLRPLQIQNTYFWCDQNPHVAGGLISTAADYVNFMGIFLPGSGKARRIFPNNTRQALSDIMSNQTGQLPIVNSPYTDLIPDPEVETRYGLGVWREVIDPQGRPLVLADPGSKGTIPWVDRRCGVTGFLLQEEAVPGSTSELYSVYLQIRQILHDELGCSI